jgi:phosphoesterase RecJ-like protein
MDLDALGSSLALSALFDYWGKRHFIFAAKKIPDSYSDLQDINKIIVATSFKELNIAPDVIVLPDLGSLHQLGELFTKNQEVFSSAKVVHIDHHYESDIVPSLRITDTKAVSTCELVALLFKYFGFVAPAHILTILLAGIMSDSRSFSTPGVSSRTLKIASWLLDKGADALTASRLARGHTFSQLKLWGLSLAKAERICGGQVGLVMITMEMIEESGNKTARTSGLINLLDETLGLSASVILREILSGEIIATFRSPRKLEVLEIARKFGGGGHVFAATCNLGHISFDRAKEIIVSEFSQLIDSKGEQHVNKECPAIVGGAVACPTATSEPGMRL